MPADDRDQQFERALAKHLRNASPDSACPDAEILAAYHEGTLPLEEMARWKEHIAGCARCQESLALVEQTANVHVEEWEHQSGLQPVEQMAHPQVLPSAHAAARRSEQAPSLAPIAAATSASVIIRRTRPPWRLLVPLGTLAAGAIIWVGVREMRTQQLQQLAESQMAQNRPTIPPPSAQSDALQNLRKGEPSAQRQATGSPPQTALTKPSPRVVTAQPSGASGAPSLSENDFANSKQKDAPPSAVAGRVAAVPSPAPVSSYAAKSRSLEALTPPPANPPAPSPAATPAVPRKEENKKVATSASQTVEVQSSAQALDSTSSLVIAGEAPNFANLVQLAQADRRYVVAPGEKHAWRLGNTGKIERSTDRGQTWRSQKSGVTADLIAGSATSDKVCWVVGKAGTLLLTTDGGKHWKLLSSPIAEDLGGIHATDSSHASVWDVPNRQSYETSDGGATWRRAANE
jgi:hypothetical protein